MEESYLKERGVVLESNGTTEVMMENMREIYAHCGNQLRLIK